MNELPSNCFTNERIHAGYICAFSCCMGPPNFYLSRQFTHSLQSFLVQPRHLPHAALHLFLSICSTVCPVFVGCVTVCPVVVVCYCLSSSCSLWYWLSTSRSLWCCLSTNCSLCYCLSSSCSLWYCLSTSRSLWCSLSTNCSL